MTEGQQECLPVVQTPNADSCRGRTWTFWRSQNHQNWRYLFFIGRWWKAMTYSRLPTAYECISEARRRNMGGLKSGIQHLESMTVDNVVHAICDLRLTWIPDVNVGGLIQPLKFLVLQLIFSKLDGSSFLWYFSLDQSSGATGRWRLPPRWRRVCC